MRFATVGIVVVGLNRSCGKEKTRSGGTDPDLPQPDGSACCRVVGSRYPKAGGAGGRDEHSDRHLACPCRSRQPRARLYRRPDHVLPHTGREPASGTLATSLRMDLGAPQPGKRPDTTSCPTCCQAGLKELALYMGPTKGAVIIVMPPPLPHCRRPTRPTPLPEVAFIPGRFGEPHDQPT